MRKEEIQPNGVKAWIVVVLDCGLRWRGGEVHSGCSRAVMLGGSAD